MRKVAILMLLVFIIGCNNKDNPVNSSSFDGEGYILEVTDSRILVIEDKYLNKKWKDIFSEYSGRAIWLKTNTSKLKPGQKIYYKIRGGVDQSYPEQATAKEIRVVTE